MVIIFVCFAIFSYYDCYCNYYLTIVITINKFEANNDYTEIMFNFLF